ncbi:MAG: hypothetical protein OEZ43_05970 [Gammaproteobacteria bacterium]|nr:hypothetical protein [Gammaproteobacteria bacterium]
MAVSKKKTLLAAAILASLTPGASIAAIFEGATLGLRLVTELSEDVDDVNDESARAKQEKVNSVEVEPVKKEIAQQAPAKVEEATVLAPTKDTPVKNEAADLVNVDNIELGDAERVAKATVNRESHLITRPTEARDIPGKRQGPPIFQALPKSIPEIFPRSVKIELTNAQELIPELSYSFKIQNFLTGISYDSLKYATSGNIDDVSDSAVGRNRMNRHLKMMPLSWAFKASDAYFAIGPFYGRREIERTEYGVLTIDSGTETPELVNFNNEVILNGQQLGLQGAFHFGNKYFSIRGSADFPFYSTLVVNESSLFRTTSNFPKKNTQNTRFGFSFSGKLDALIKTPYFVDVFMNASFDRLPMNFSQLSATYDQSDMLIKFASTKYDAVTTTMSFGAGLLIDIPNSLDLLPSVEAKLVQQNIHDNVMNSTLEASSLLVSIGFSGRF